MHSNHVCICGFGSCKPSYHFQKACFARAGFLYLYGRAVLRFLSITCNIFPATPSQLKSAPPIRPYMPKCNRYIDQETTEFAGVFFQGPFRLSNLSLNNANPSAYLYGLLHPALLAVAGYFIVNEPLSFAIKLLLLTLACFATTWLIYQCIARPFILPKMPFGPKHNSTKQHIDIAFFQNEYEKQSGKRAVL